MSKKNCGKGDGGFIARPQEKRGKSRPLSDAEYLGIMERVAQENYGKWGYGSPEEALVHALNDNTYDYRGYYDKYPQSMANADTHWTDEFKTVYHPTFSGESRYSGVVDRNYNPMGLVGGRWVGERFEPAEWQKPDVAEFYDIGGMIGTDWNGLSRGQKQRWMRHAIGHGVTDFGKAKEMFESRFKDGGKIEIDPKNMGRFNATKKRTGKTTEELTHSKNPLTRRRAIFAQNAAKWRHDDGGQLLVGGSPNSLSYGRSLVEEPGMTQRYGRVYTPFMYTGMEMPQARTIEELRAEDAALAARQREARLEWLADMMPVVASEARQVVSPVRYSRGKLRSEIEQLFKERLGWTEGKEYRLGREVRPRDVYEKQGIGSPNSHHFSGNAVDLTAGSLDYDDIIRAMVGDEMVRRFFEENGLGVYDERTPKGSHRSTGAHLHLGPDRVAVEDWNGFLRQHGYADGGPIGGGDDDYMDENGMVYGQYYPEQWAILPDVTKENVRKSWGLSKQTPSVVQMVMNDVKYMKSPQGQEKLLGEIEKKQREYEELRNTVRNNPLLMGAFSTNPWGLTVLANKTPEGQKKSADNMMKLYDGLLNAALMGQLGSNIVLGNIPQRMQIIGGLAGSSALKPIEDQIVKSASDGKYNGWIDMFAKNNLPSSFGVVTDPAFIIGGKYGSKYANHVGRNTMETVMRLGDLAHNNPREGAMILLKDPNTYKFILGNRPDLAYKVGLEYSGNTANHKAFDSDGKVIQHGDAHPGDMVDVWFGKAKSPYKEIPLTELSDAMQTYVKKHYPNRNVRAYDIGVVKSRYGAPIAELPIDGQLRGQYLNNPSLMRFNETTGEYDYLLDPGNYRVRDNYIEGDHYTQLNEDLWQYNPNTYFENKDRKLGFGSKSKLTQGVLKRGLRAFNEYGNPMLHTWKDETPIVWPSE